MSCEQRVRRLVEVTSGEVEAIRRRLVASFEGSVGNLTIELRLKLTIEMKAKQAVLNELRTLPEHHSVGQEQEAEHHHPHQAPAVQGGSVAELLAAPQAALPVGGVQELTAPATSDLLVVRRRP